MLKNTKPLASKDQNVVQMWDEMLSSIVIMEEPIDWFVIMYNFMFFLNI
jgi:hypothetical protein